MARIGFWLVLTLAWATIMQTNVAKAELLFSEQSALQALHVAFTGIQTDTWSTNYSDGCSFSGVTCNSNSQIVEIVISDTKRDGVINAALSGLEAIERLTFINPIRNPLDPSVFSLFSLKYLHVSNSIALDSIPLGLMNLTHLESLVLEHTSIANGPQEIFGSLPNLTLLSLAWNDLSFVPSSLSDLPNIHTLDLSGNPVAEIPTWLTTLPLRKFSCSSCSLLNWPSTWFSSTPCLEELNLANNSLSTFPASTQTDPSCLTFVNLEKNLLHDASFIPVPAGINASLKLAHNQFTTVPEGICNSESLQTLDMSKNLLQLLPASCLALAPITSLDLSSNQLVQVPSAIANFSQLVSLNLSNNNFSGSIPTTLTQLPNTVSIADLSNAGFTGAWPHFPFLIDFILLNASHNHLFFDEMETHFPYLNSSPNSTETAFIQGTLDLSYNDFQSIPTLYLALDRLHINLRANQLENISNAFSTVFSWTEKHIDLSLNPSLIGTVPASFLMTATSLNLSGCGFSTFETFSTFPTLSVLDLSRNVFSPSVMGLTLSNTQFEWLSLAGNGISSQIPANLFGNFEFPSWTHLDLSDNALTGEVPTTLHQRIALQYLDISSNQLTGNIPNFQNLTNLTVAYVDGNLFDYCNTNPYFPTSVMNCSCIAAAFSQICDCPAFYAMCTSRPSTCSSWPEPAVLIPEVAPQTAGTGPQTYETPLPEIDVPSPFSSINPSLEPLYTPLDLNAGPDVVPETDITPQMEPEIYSPPLASVPIPSSPSPVPSPVLLPSSNLPVGTIRPFGICWQEDAGGAVLAYFGHCSDRNETTLYLRGLNNYFSVSASLIAVGTEPPTTFHSGCHALSGAFDSQSSTLAKWRLNGHEATVLPKDESMRCRQENVTATFFFTQLSSTPVSWLNFTTLLSNIMATSTSRLDVVVNDTSNVVTPVLRKIASNAQQFEVVVTIMPDLVDSSPISTFWLGHRLSKAMTNPIYVRMIENSTGCTQNSFKLSTTMEPVWSTPILDGSPTATPIATGGKAPSAKKFSAAQLTAIVLGSAFLAALCIASAYSVFLWQRNPNGGFLSSGSLRKSSKSGSTRADSSSKSRTTNTITSASVRWDDVSELEDFSPDEKTDDSSYDESTDASGPSSSVDVSNHPVSSLDSDTLRLRQRKAQESRDGYDDSESPVLDTGDTREDCEVAEESEQRPINEWNGPASSRNDPESDSQSQPSYTTEEDSETIPKARPPRVPRVSGTDELRSADEEEWSEEDYSSVTSS